MLLDSIRGMSRGWVHQPNYGWRANANDPPRRDPPLGGQLVATGELFTIVNTTHFQRISEERTFFRPL